MPLSPADRANAQYAQTPGLSQLSAAERQKLQTALLNIWGADTTYLVANVTVEPVALIGPPMTVAAGIPVATAGSPSAQTGATTLLANVVGTGSIT